ncbi:hypothetical protein BDV25DRAFT_142716 [Aspergillus avenaceus]|uniref:Uncharacterized protein n=1 Tax=Aspergillus avenaceus TaxID=36643 RepID=A0A5N6TMC5_ASPAV|nr:hypothetical protein BDV25DRAFT_142716 [Aspergillus avenaceus]
MVKQPGHNPTVEVHLDVDEGTSFTDSEDILCAMKRELMLVRGDYGPVRHAAVQPQKGNRPRILLRFTTAARTTRGVYADVERVIRAFEEILASRTVSRRLFRLPVMLDGWCFVDRVCFDGEKKGDSRGLEYAEFSVRSAGYESIEDFCSKVKLDSPVRF